MTTTADDELITLCATLTDGLTLPKLQHRNATEFADLPALSWNEQITTFAELRAQIAKATRGLTQHGLQPGQRLMIMMSARPEHWIADSAAVHARAIPCTAYQTLSSEQIGFVAEHSGATIAVLEGASEVERWLPQLDQLTALERIVVLDAAAIPASDERFVSWVDLLETGARLHDADPEIFENGWKDIESDDPIAMMYTSGTTGDPKGVVLSHRNAFYEAVAVDQEVDTPMHAKSVAYLPLAHIAERELAFYRAAYKAQHVTICSDPTQVVAALAKTRPPGFFGVPRVWEKLAAGLRAKIGTLGEAQRTGVMQAHAVAAEAYRLAGRGEPVPPELAAQAEAVDELALRPIRAMLGLDELRWGSSGAAPIPTDVLDYLGGFGIRVLEVWGMSETTGAATVSLPDHFRVGAVGRPIPGVDLRIADDGEIFVRGPIVFLGYLQDDGTIASVLDEDGWLATGDVGTIDNEGFLTITDRKKELLITSSGKNIAPTKIEGLLRLHPLVGQVIAIGDRRPYLTALLTLDEESAPLWAQAHGIAYDNLGDLANDDRVKAELENVVAAANNRLSRAEQVKRYEILSDSWTPETGELTPTLKLRRRVVLDHYEQQIDGLYG